MKMRLLLVAGLILVSTQFLPTFANDAAGDIAKDEAKAQSEAAKAMKQKEDHHPLRARRAAKKAEKAKDKVIKEETKAAGIK